MCTKIEIPESHLPEIESALAKEKDAKVVRWLLGIRLMALKKTPHDIGPQLNASERTVRNWAHRFLADGIEGMHRHPGSGHQSFLSHEEQERFKERIRQGPTEADGVATWRGLSVIEMLRREFGVSYTRSGVYDLMHRMGFSLLMPRARHPESSEEEQGRFKKNTAQCGAESQPPQARQTHRAVVPG